MKTKSFIKSITTSGSPAKTYVSYLRYLDDIIVYFERFTLHDRTDNDLRIIPDYCKVKIFKDKVLVRNAMAFKQETFRTLIDELIEITNQINKSSCI